MKYDEDAFNSAVEDYKKLIKAAKNQNFLIIFGVSNRQAFYSLAPLSRALHELGADASCTAINKKSEGLDALKDVWKAFEEHEKGTKDENTKALIDFIEEVDKKASGNFKKLFKIPDFILEADNNGFEGSFKLPFHAEWFNEYRMDELIQTSDILWKDVYALKKGERVGRIILTLTQ
ncbi:hypothetical protein HYX07_04750 [Candidatus Woesearchaeota archaeon]|nr:hypothetical protein [Candidatus Woesearchaeota archaeon]